MASTSLLASFLLAGIDGRRRHGRGAKDEADAINEMDRTAAMLRRPPPLPFLNGGRTILDLWGCGWTRGAVVDSSSYVHLLNGYSLVAE
jgi:hypothetical protein